MQAQLVESGVGREKEALQLERGWGSPEMLSAPSPQAGAQRFPTSEKLALGGDKPKNKPQLQPLPNSGWKLAGLNSRDFNSCVSLRETWYASRKPARRSRGLKSGARLNK